MGVSEDTPKKEEKTMVIDFHTHAFPDKIAKRAVDKLADASGGLTPYTDGTADGLARRTRESGVDVPLDALTVEECADAIMAAL